MSTEPQGRVQIAASHWRPRFVANGIDLNDFEKVVGSTADWKDWGPNWLKMGDVHLDLAEDAARAPHRLRYRGLPARRLVLPPWEIPLVRGSRPSRAASPADGGHLRQGPSIPRSSRRTGGGSVRVGGDSGHPSPAPRRESAAAGPSRARPRFGEGGAVCDRERFLAPGHGHPDDRRTRPG